MTAPVPGWGGEGGWGCRKGDADDVIKQAARHDGVPVDELWLMSPECAANGEGGICTSHTQSPTFKG
jgi:hypothetical protein